MDKNEILIKTICGISNCLTMHQIVEKDMLFRVLCNRLKKLDRETLDQAIDICKEELVITAHNEKYIWQTNSVLHKQMNVDEIDAKINELQY